MPIESLGCLQGLHTSCRERITPTFIHAWPDTKVVSRATPPPNPRGVASETNTSSMHVNTVYISDDHYQFSAFPLA